MGLFGKPSWNKDKVHAIDLGRGPSSLPKRDAPHIPSRCSDVSPTTGTLRSRLGNLFLDEAESPRVQFNVESADGSELHLNNEQRGGIYETESPRPPQSEILDGELPGTVSFSALCERSPRLEAQRKTADIHIHETSDSLTKALSPQRHSRRGRSKSVHGVRRTEPFELANNLPDVSRHSGVLPSSTQENKRASGQVAMQKSSFLQRSNSISRLARKASLKRKYSLKNRRPDRSPSSPSEEGSREFQEQSFSTLRTVRIIGSDSAATTGNSSADHALDQPMSPMTPFELVHGNDSLQQQSPLESTHNCRTEFREPTRPQEAIEEVLQQQQLLPKSASQSRMDIANADGHVLWDKIDSGDFADGENYDIEAATQTDFYPEHNEATERLYNSPSTPKREQDIPFLDEDSQEQLATELKLLCYETGAGAGGAAGSVANSPKPSAKPRKRPPPLLPPDSAQDSANSYGSSPQTGVFGSNGDFTTGGFKITSHGMVDKPERATRLDSDDGPSSRVPQSSNILVPVNALSEFRKGPTLGAGAAGRVYLAIHEPSGRSMAIKTVNVYDQAKRNQLLKELDTLSTHVSRFLVRFYGAFYDGTGAVHIALEFMDGGCLSSTVQSFGAIPEKVTQMIAVDCLRALRFLHRHNVLHRDFKTANVLLSQKLLCAKVSDFGLARDLNAGVSRVDTFVGTVAYMSPERLQGSQYTYASDIWALGISILECLMGRYPFERPQSYFDYIDATMSKNVMRMVGPGSRHFSPAVADFVSLCTQNDPRRRPTAAALLEHPWITGTKRDVTLFKTWMDNNATARSRSTQSVRSIQSVRSFLTGNQPRY